MLDVREHTLRLVNYSTGFRGRVSRAELEAHLHSLPDLPDAIPYVTSYYAPRWGFCLSERERAALPDGAYDVVIDAEHVDGSLTIGEAVLPGEEPGEVLLSTYTCHPSLANNELSGPLVTALLYRRLAAWPRRRLTFRFVFLPETIGSLAYLGLRGEHLRRHLRAGYVVTCVGTGGPATYKRSRQGASLADRAAVHVLGRRRPGGEPRVLDFFPDRGSDERQYCSPGFDLPVGSLMRAMYGAYPEYHTSLDDRAFISFEAMAETIDVYAEVLAVLDASVRYRNLAPHGEPQLGRRGLYPTLGTREGGVRTSALMWLLNFSDGRHDLLAIAERSGHEVSALHEAALRAVDAGLLERVDGEAT
jgi:aminopeptidase-like protein